MFGFKKYSSIDRKTNALTVAPITTTSDTMSNSENPNSPPLPPSVVAALENPAYERKTPKVRIPATDKASILSLVLRKPVPEEILEDLINKLTVDQGYFDLFHEMTMDETRKQHQQDGGFTR